MKKAVILFNLGGPDSLDAVEPFLLHLFSDPAIIRLPNPLRFWLAKFISSKRAPKTKKIYEYIGNKSPLLELSQDQAKALEKILNTGTNSYKCFVAMRYWHPFASEVIKEVKNFEPDEIILLPLYPQFSTTTTASSLKDWHEQAKKIGLCVPHKTIGCYPNEAFFIQAHADLILNEIHQLSKEENFRIVFSAHGLPEKIIKAGDPYQWQVEQTVMHTVNLLTQKLGHSIDYVISYQSRVGRLKWLGPSTEAEICRAGQEEKTLLLSPISFVSEHSETLVELDIEYRHLAENAGVKKYIRVPALGTHSAFIEALAQLCKATEYISAGNIISNKIRRICPKQYKNCICGTSKS